MTFLSLILSLAIVLWLTFALLPESRKEWVFAPLVVTFTLVAAGLVIVEAFTAWIMLSAITQLPVACAIAVMAVHLIFAVAIWRSR